MNLAVPYNDSRKNRRHQCWIQQQSSKLQYYCSKSRRTVLNRDRDSLSNWGGQRLRLELLSNASRPRGMRVDSDETRVVCGVDNCKWNWYRWSIYQQSIEESSERKYFKVESNLQPPIWNHPKSTLHTPHSTLQSQSKGQEKESLFHSIFHSIFHLRFSKREKCFTFFFE